TIALEREEDPPLISEVMLVPIALRANQLLARAPITLSYTDPADNSVLHPSSRGQQYFLVKEQLKDLMTPVEEQGAFTLGIKEAGAK
ncbi:MAG: hypothetical protein AAB630_00175, partial [Patescibacteria group bacterium]